MIKISKQTKLKAILAYLSGEGSFKTVAHKYGLAVTPLQLLVAAYKTHGASVLFDPPTVNARFRIELVTWMIENQASYTQVVAEFGYINTHQIQLWREKYRQSGPNGLLSIVKGRNPKMKKQAQNKQRAKNLTPEQQKIQALEDKVLELQIKNEALKLLALRTSATKSLPKSSANSRPNSN